MNKPRTFEECVPEIEKIIESKRPEWTFKASVMIDFDDIKSEILTHIWKQWSKYDQSRPLGAWVSVVVRHQTINILRNTYLSTSSPCSQCACDLGEGMCSMFGEQGEVCPLYKAWCRKKKQQHLARLPLPLDKYLDEVKNVSDSSIDLEAAVENLHKRLESELTKTEWQIYKAVYIEHKDNDQAAKELEVGAKRVRQVKILALRKAKEILAEHGLEYTLLDNERTEPTNPD